MRRGALLLGILFLSMLSIASAQAAKATTPKWQLERDASHVVVGKVETLSFIHKVEGSYRITYHVADNLIDKVEKEKV